jgi:hypothetical protein
MRTPAREILLTVAGLPPAKNEALSMLGAGHRHGDRIIALLEAAAAVLAAGAKPFGPERLGLEVTVRGPVDAPSDATNYLGGIADVLESKGHRGALEHLGPLGLVALYPNDRQIREVRYREEAAPETSYEMRLWAMESRPEA